MFKYVTCDRITNEFILFDEDQSQHRVRWKNWLKSAIEYYIEKEPNNIINICKLLCISNVYWDDLNRKNSFNVYNYFIDDSVPEKYKECVKRKLKKAKIIGEDLIIK